jgi:hypothetical protein
VRLKHSVAILLFLLLHSENGLACSFAPGYFYQVTAIRGRIVSYTWRLRRLWGSVGVADATLTLYEYRFPANIEDLKRISTVTTDSDGNFDFGPIPKGHYHLRIDADQMDNWFDVEVIDTVSKTDRIIVDVSPVAPDCTGGHKFTEKRL